MTSLPPYSAPIGASPSSRRHWTGTSAECSAGARGKKPRIHGPGIGLSTWSGSASPISPMCSGRWRGVAPLWLSTVTDVEYPAQLNFEFNDPLFDWSSLEDHVVDGCFLPPLTEDALRRIAARERRLAGRPSEPELISFKSTQFSLDSEAVIYRSSTRRLRYFRWTPPVFVVEHVNGSRTRFDFHREIEIRGDWSARGYRSTAQHARILIINSDWCPQRGPGIEVHKNGPYWIAKFDWSEEHAQRVRGAGFVFDPVTRDWQTEDRAVAAALDPSLEPGRVADHRPKLRVPHSRSERGIRVTR